MILLILTVLELNIFLKKLNDLLVIKICKQIFLEYKHMIRLCEDIFVLNLLISCLNVKA